MEKLIFSHIRQSSCEVKTGTLKCTGLAACRGYPFLDSYRVIRVSLNTPQLVLGRVSDLFQCEIHLMRISTGEQRLKISLGSPGSAAAGEHHRAASLRRYTYGTYGTYGAVY